MPGGIRASSGLVRAGWKPSEAGLTEAGRARERMARRPENPVYGMAATAVAANSVAPTEAVISDTSAYAINSFIVLFLVARLFIETIDAPLLFTDRH